MELHLNFSSGSLFNSSFIPSLSSVDSRLKIRCCIQKLLLAEWKYPWKDCRNTCKCLCISMTMGNDIVPLEIPSSYGKLTYFPDPMRLIQIESLLVKADTLYLAVIMFTRCSLKEGIQVVTVAEYTCRVWQGPVFFGHRPKCFWNDWKN